MEGINKIGGLSFLQKRNPVSSLKGGSSFVNFLEKHIDDYQKGKGNISGGTGRVLQERSVEARNSLIDINVKAASLFGAYRTAFNAYGESARFVSNVYESSAFTKLLLTAEDRVPSKEEIIEKYTRKPSSLPNDVATVVSTTNETA